MKLQIIKICSFWAVISFMVYSVVESNPPNSPNVSNIQLQKPAVVKVKKAKKLSVSAYASTSGKRLAMK